MTFFVLALIAIYLALIFKKYKHMWSAIVIIAFLIGATTSLMVWGLRISTAGEKLVLFNSQIQPNEFYFLFAAWYILDILCAIKIIRNHLEYKKSNPDS